MNRTKEIWPVYILLAVGLLFSGWWLSLPLQVEQAEAGGAITNPVPPSVTYIVTEESTHVGTKGTPVAIVGNAALGEATKVFFGSTSALFVAINESELGAVAPAGTGTVDVTVVTPHGVSRVVPADEFTYLPESLPVTVTPPPPVVTPPAPPPPAPVVTPSVPHGIVNAPPLPHIINIYCCEHVKRHHHKHHKRRRKR